MSMKTKLSSSIGGLTTPTALSIGVPGASPLIVNAVSDSTAPTVNSLPPTWTTSPTASSVVNDVPAPVTVVAPEASDSVPVRSCENGIKSR